MNHIDEARFWRKVVRQQGDCWMWQGSPRPDGYGELRTSTAKKLAHRLSYAIAYGPVPPGLQIDHTCHNADDGCVGGSRCAHRLCVNPGHLEAVTQQENIRRGQSGQHQLAKSTCPQGHPYAGANLKLERDGRRRCRRCSRKRSREAMQRARERASK